MRTDPVHRASVVVAFGLLVAGASLAANPDPALDPLNLRFDAGYTSRLRWDAPAAAATLYGLYRGTIGAAGMRAYDHACELTEGGYRTTRDEDVPPAGEAYYYLVTGYAVSASGQFTVGRLGTDSKGIARPDATSFTCGPRVHVDPSLTSSGDGSDWAHAYHTLGEALRHAPGSDRGLEIWVKGTVSEGTVRYDGAAHPNLSILGGFAGTELRPWQRQPVATPSGGFTLAVPNSARSVRLDGVTGATLTHEGLAGSTVVLRDAHGASDLSVAPASGATSSGAVLVEDSDLDGGGVSVTAAGTTSLLVRRSTLVSSGVRATLSSGTLSMLVEDCTLRAHGIGITAYAGTATAVVRRNHLETAGIDCRADSRYTAGAFLSAVVEQNRFAGGRTGIESTVIGQSSMGAYAEVALRVASNVFTGLSGDAIDLETQLWTVEGGAALNDALVVGNTFVDIAGSVVVTTVRGWGDELAGWRSSASPTFWDNVITGCGGPAFREGSDMEPYNVADVVAIGNDVHGNAVLFLDEGATEIHAVDELNALPGARDNFALDPLFADAAAGDYRLLAGSPCLDRGHRDRPRGTVVDADGGPRFEDADGNGIAEPDVGAFEYHPELLPVTPRRR